MGMTDDKLLRYKRNESLSNTARSNKIRLQNHATSWGYNVDHTKVKTSTIPFNTNMMVETDIPNYNCHAFQ